MGTVESISRMMQAATDHGHSQPIPGFLLLVTYIIWIGIPLTRNQTKTTCATSGLARLGATWQRVDIILPTGPGQEWSYELSVRTSWTSRVFKFLRYPFKPQKGSCGVPSSHHPTIGRRKGQSGHSKVGRQANNGQQSPAASTRDVWTNSK